MTTVDDRLRESAARIAPQHDSIPPFPALQRRGRRRQFMMLTAIVAAVLGITWVATATRSTSHRVFVANHGTGGNATSTTSSVSISIVPGNRPAPHEYPYDLIGNAPPIVIDHLGKYTWTSPVLIKFLPGAWNFGYHAGGSGTAAITNPNARLVNVHSRFALRVTFTVQSFTGSPTLQLIARANGPSPTTAPKGSVLIPDVVGMTRDEASSALNRMHLGVVVAVADPAQDAIVVAQSPIPSTALPVNGVVTITLGDATSPQACEAGELHVQVLPLPVGASTSQRQADVTFTNSSAQRCTLRGYPTITFAGTSARPHDELPRQADSVETVVLAPNTDAHALLTYLVDSPPQCGGRTPFRPTEVLVTAPGTTARISAAWSGASVDDCHGGATHPATYVGAIHSTLRPDPSSP